MNEGKLTKIFIEIKEKANPDYAITNTDNYGNCSSCVYASLSQLYG